jgi:hypothetical protein
MPAPDEARRLLVLEAGETELAITRLPGGGHALDASGEPLGELAGDLMPFLLGDQIVFAGAVDDGTETVLVGNQVCKVAAGVWMTFPMPFTAGMTVTAVWRDGTGNALWQAQTPPLTPDRLEPVHGPGWTSYAPLDKV